MRLLDVCAAVVLVAGSITAVVLAIQEKPKQRADFTNEVRLDTIGTKGFEIQRTLPDRVAGSPDPILVARESLLAQRGLCDGRFDVQEITITNTPPTLIYEAKIRCF